MYLMRKHLNIFIIIINYKLNKIMSEPIMNLGQLEDRDEISEKKPNHHKLSLENLTLHQSFFTKE